MLKGQNRKTRELKALKEEFGSVLTNLVQVIMQGNYFLPRY